MMLEERDLVEDAADRWWLFLLTGISWLIVALLIFQWSYTTVYAVSYLFGFMAIFAGLNEFMALTVSSSGWRIVRVILGVLFLIAGIWALVHPHNAFATLAGLVGFFLLFKGIFDVMAAFMARIAFETLVAPADECGIFVDRACLLGGGLVQGQGDPARRLLSGNHRRCSRGITELILAFRAQGLAAAGRGRLRRAAFISR